MVLLIASSYTGRWNSVNITRKLKCLQTGRDFIYNKLMLVQIAFIRLFTMVRSMAKAIRVPRISGYKLYRTESLLVYGESEKRHCSFGIERMLKGSMRPVSWRAVDAVGNITYGVIRNVVRELFIGMREDYGLQMQNLSIKKLIIYTGVC